MPAPAHAALGTGARGGGGSSWRGCGSDAGPGVVVDARVHVRLGVLEVAAVQVRVRAELRAVAARGAHAGSTGTPGRMVRAGVRVRGVAARVRVRVLGSSWRGCACGHTRRGVGTRGADVSAGALRRGCAGGWGRWGSPRCRSACGRRRWRHRGPSALAGTSAGTHVARGRERQGVVVRVRVRARVLGPSWLRGRGRAC